MWGVKRSREPCAAWQEQIKYEPGVRGYSTRFLKKPSASSPPRTRSLSNSPVERARSRAYELSDPHRGRARAAGTLSRVTSPLRRRRAPRRGRRPDAEVHRLPGRDRRARAGARRCRPRPRCQTGPPRGGVDGVRRDAAVRGRVPPPAVRAGPHPGEAGAVGVGACPGGAGTRSDRGAGEEAPSRHPAVSPRAAGTIARSRWNVTRSATAARSGASRVSPASASPPPRARARGSRTVTAVTRPSARAATAARHTRDAASSSCTTPAATPGAPVRRMAPRTRSSGPPTAVPTSSRVICDGGGAVGSGEVVAAARPVSAMTESAPAQPTARAATKPSAAVARRRRGHPPSFRGTPPPHVRAPVPVLPGQGDPAHAATGVGAGAAPGTAAVRDPPHTPTGTHPRAC